MMAHIAYQLLTILVATCPTYKFKCCCIAAADGAINIRVSVRAQDQGPRPRPRRRYHQPLHIVAGTRYHCENRRIESTKQTHVVTSFVAHRSITDQCQHHRLQNYSPTPMHQLLSCHQRSYQHQKKSTTTQIHFNAPPPLSMSLIPVPVNDLQDILP